MAINKFQIIKALAAADRQFEKALDLKKIKINRTPCGEIDGYQVEITIPMTVDLSGRPKYKFGNDLIEALRPILGDFYGAGYGMETYHDGIEHIWVMIEY